MVTARGLTSLRLRGKPVLYEIDQQDVVTKVDEAWDAFAQENRADHLVGAGVVGSSLWRHIRQPETKQLYKELLRRVRKFQTSACLPFRCDSAAERRFLELHIEPLGASQVRFVSTTTRIEARDPVALFDWETPRTADLLLVCGWCKKIQLFDDSWVEVEAAVRSLRLFDAALPELTHGLCAHCFQQATLALPPKRGAPT